MTKMTALPSPRGTNHERLFVVDAHGRAPAKLVIRRGGTAMMMALDADPGTMQSPSAGNTEKADPLTEMRNAIEQAISPSGELHLPPDVQGKLLEILYKHAAPDYAKVKGEDANGGKDELSDEEKRAAVIERLRDEGVDEAALEQVKAAYQWWDVERRKRGNGATFPASAARNGLGGALAGGRELGSSLRPQAEDNAAARERFAKRYPGVMDIGAESAREESRRGLAFDAKADADFCKRFPQAGRIGTM